MSKRIYIAGPYTKGDQVQNVRNAIEAGDILRNFGFIPFIPHLNMLWHAIFPHNADYWYEWDIEWLKQCDVLIRLPGESVGADREMEIAKELFLDIYAGEYAVDNFLDDYYWQLRREGGEKIDWEKTIENLGRYNRGLRLVGKAKQAGLTLKVVGDKLVIRGPKSEEELAQEMLDYKAEIIKILNAKTKAISNDQPE